MHSSTVQKIHAIDMDAHGYAMGTRETLTNEQVAEFNEAWNVYDVNRTGELSLNDANKAMASLGFAESFARKRAVEARWLQKRARSQIEPNSPTASSVTLNVFLDHCGASMDDCEGPRCTLCGSIEDGRCRLNPNMCNSEATQRYFCTRVANSLIAEAPEDLVSLDDVLFALPDVEFLEERGNGTWCSTMTAVEGSFGSDILRDVEFLLRHWNALFVPENAIRPSDSMWPLLLAQKRGALLPAQQVPHATLRRVFDFLRVPLSSIERCTVWDAQMALNFIVMTAGEPHIMSNDAEVMEALDEYDEYLHQM